MEVQILVSEKRNNRPAFESSAGQRSLKLRLTKSRENLFAWLALALLPVLLAAQSNVAAFADTARPRLILLVVADEFAYNYLVRYGDKFGSGGFKLLKERGANFTNCRFRNASTSTAVGHSVIATGAYPWATGIVADTFYDRRKSKPVSCVADDSAQLVGANGTGSSTRLLQGTTIGDQMKLSSNGRSKVISLSLKDSSALLLAGRLANNAYWFDNKTGMIVTSNQYGSQMASWVQAFNDKHYADQFVGKPWQRLLPEQHYSASTRDDYPYEKGMPEDGKQFPHVISGTGSQPGEVFYGNFAMTPFANQMLSDLASEAIDHEMLGQHVDPDLLAISYSAGEDLCNAFGPYSQEVEDLTLRLDQSLASLLQHIDQKVGLNNCLVVFTSDHGVSPIPEFAKERGMEAGRIDPKSFKNLLDQALDSRLGADDWIEAVEPPNIYLNLNAIDKHKFRQPDVEALTSKLCHSVPGVGESFSAVQFYTNQLPSGPMTDAVTKSYYWGRSGEVLVTLKPGYIFSTESSGTSTGSPHTEDAQVPLFISGSQIQPGTYATSVTPADIAATVTAILNIAAPSLCEGRALSEALSRSAAAPRAYESQPQPQQPESGKETRRR